MGYLDDDPTPGFLALSSSLGKEWIHQQVGERGVAAIRLLDVVQEIRTDNATTLQRRLYIDGIRVSL